MDALLPILAVWAGLCIVLIGYVVYRFATDRPDGSARHILFPLASNPTDSAFPSRSAWLEWAGYICLLGALSSMLVGLASEVGLISAPFLGQVAGVTFLLGLGLVGLARVVRKK